MTRASAPRPTWPDGNGNVVDGYTYDVFGAIRSQSGSSDNYWLFAREQRDADRGEVALKGFDEPVRLYEVRWRD